MEAESADSIVGINAPVDLAGRTPLAWSVRSRARNKQVRAVAKLRCAQLLFAFLKSDFCEFRIVFAVK